METVTAQFDLKAVAQFCREHNIRKLSLFGSALRDDFSDQSDIDILVEFVPGHEPGFIGLASMELELSGLTGGRKIDMNTYGCLSPYFRDKVVAEAKLLYERKGH
jgi:predicted nucleotidyltransferase